MSGTRALLAVWQPVSGSGRTAQCHEKHPGSEVRQSRHRVRTQASPGSLPASAPQCSQPRLWGCWGEQAVGPELLAGMPCIRGLQAGFYDPSCVSAPGPWGERSLLGEPKNRWEGGDTYHLQQGPRLGLPEAAQRGHERKADQLQARKCLCSRHTPPGGGCTALLEEPRRLETVASETRTTEFLGCGRVGHGEPLPLQEC